MPTPEDIDNQQQLLATYRRTLAHYLAQRAIHGRAYMPASIAHSIDEARDGIRRSKGNLRGWGVEVEDLPDDEEADAPARISQAGAAKPASQQIRSAPTPEETASWPGASRPAPGDAPAAERPLGYPLGSHARQLSDAQRAFLSAIAERLGYGAFDTKLPVRRRGKRRFVRHLDTEVVFDISDDELLGLARLGYIQLYTNPLTVVLKRDILDIGDNPQR